MFAFYDVLPGSDCIYTPYLPAIGCTKIHHTPPAIQTGWRLMNYRLYILITWLLQFSSILKQKPPALTQTYHAHGHLHHLQ